MVRACAALAPALAALLIYAPAVSFGVVTLDDPVYVMNNPHVLGGLTWEGVQWAFSPGHDTYWHPLVWISLMLDGSISASPGWFHLVNILLHAASASILYLALSRMSGNLAAPLVVALLFAAHPLNVEAVAWITERKTVLAGLFWMSAMYLYALYAAKPGPLRYLAALAALALGLLAKPLLVTLPCALLLLDYWPLKRLSLSPGARDGMSPAMAVAEKLPMFIVVAGSIAMTMLSHPMESGQEGVSPGLRAANAAVSYIRYMAKAFWPTDLAMYYPFPEALAPWQVWGAAALLATATILALALCKKAPYVIVGWLWFLGSMAPMLGLVRHDRWPALADRFAYVPLIGLFLIAAFALLSLARNAAARNAALAALASAALVLALASRNQLEFWADSETLYRRALAVTENNWLAHNNLGSVLYAQGHEEEAAEHFNRAVEIRPGYGSALVNLGLWHLWMGDWPQAEEHLRRGVGTEAEGSAWQGLADLSFEQGDYGRALIRYHKSVLKNPRLLASWRGRAESFRLAGLPGEAARAYVEAARRHLVTYRLTEAEELAQNALNLNPGMAAAKAVRDSARVKMRELIR